MPFVRCVKCQYWAKIGVTMKGLCRRHAPYPSAHVAGMEATWTTAHADEGCGDGKELPQVLQDGGLYGIAVNLQELYRNKKADQGS